MKTKHTPGPWLYSPHYREHAQGHIYLPNANENEAHTIDLVGAAGMSQEQLNANANLIAAAPDMLEALEFIFFQAIDDDTTEDDIRAMHEQMRAAALRAINKAKSAN